LLYALGSDGDLVCAEIKTGKIRWQKNLRADFGGKPGEWAYSESPLLDGEALVCAPGGEQATLLALNKKDGSVIWKSAIPGGDEAAYSSTIAVNAAGKKQYVQILKKGLTGVDAKTGKLLWRYQKMSSKYGANIPSPLASGDLIFSAGAGTGGGTVKLKSTGTGGIEAEEIYFSPKLPTAIGGAIKSGPVVYGTTAQGLECFDFANGEVKWQEKALGAAALCLADGNLYLHGENGEVAMVQAAPDAYHEKGRFTPPNQPKRSSEMEKAWTYPVVANGQLYIRDHNMLWCYDVKK
jgi:outer membrane protein assembly factor BamB